jgi:hypothetical protein
VNRLNKAIPKQKQFRLAVLLLHSFKHQSDSTVDELAVTKSNVPEYLT